MRGYVAVSIALVVVAVTGTLLWGFSARGCSAPMARMDGAFGDVWLVELQDVSGYTTHAIPCIGQPEVSPDGSSVTFVYLDGKGYTIPCDAMPPAMTQCAVPEDLVTDMR